MSDRRRLPNRRCSETFEVRAQGLRFVATISRFDDGSLGEIFISNHKAGSQSDVNARDAAITASLALQHGVPLDVLRKALTRDPGGLAAGPLGVVLDRIADEVLGGRT
jgi:ribonucleoside-diphosphate reductase alpha chain